MGAGCGRVAGAAGQGGRGPRQAARGIGGDLHGHAVAAVLVGEAARLSPSHAAGVPSSRAQETNEAPALMS